MCTVTRRVSFLKDVGSSVRRAQGVFCHGCLNSLKAEKSAVFVGHIPKELGQIYQ